MDWRTCITWAISLGLAGTVFFWGNMKNLQSRAERLRPTVLILLFSAVIISSYDILDSPPVASHLSTLLLSYLQNRWIAFTLALLIKSFLVYWIVYFLLGMLHQRRLSRTVAKIFGLEFSQELTPETVTKAKEGYKTLEEQFATLTSLNREIAEYISSPFEEEIIGETMEETVENFRDKIRKILQTAYAQVKGVKLYVIPADKQSINRLEEKLAAIVEVTWNGDDVLTINQEIGVIAYSLVSGLESIIVVDPRAGRYKLTDAEIWSIGNLLIAMASIIGWALKEHRA